MRRNDDCSRFRSCLVELFLFYQYDFPLRDYSAFDSYLGMQEMAQWLTDVRHPLGNPRYRESLTLRSCPPYLSDNASVVNNARAVRLLEITNDYRNFQHYIANIATSSASEGSSHECSTLLRSCVLDAQAVLGKPVLLAASLPPLDVEHEKAQLKMYATAPATVIGAITKGLPICSTRY